MKTTNPYTNSRSSGWYYYNYTIPGTYYLSLENINFNCVVAGGGGFGGIAGSYPTTTCSDLIGAGGGGGGGGGEVLTSTLEGTKQITIKVGNVGESSYVVSNEISVTALPGSNGVNGQNAVCISNSSTFMSGGTGGGSTGGAGATITINNGAWGGTNNGYNGSINGGGGGGGGKPGTDDYSPSYGGSGGIGIQVTFADGTGSAYFNKGATGGNGGDLTILPVNGSNAGTGSVLIYYKVSNYTGSTNPYTKVTNDFYTYYNYKIPGTYYLNITNILYNVLVCGGGGLGGNAGAIPLPTSKCYNNTTLIGPGGGGGAQSGQVLPRTIELGFETQLTLVVGDIGQTSYITYVDINGKVIKIAVANPGVNGIEGTNFRCSSSTYSSGGNGGNSGYDLSGNVLYDASGGVVNFESGVWVSSTDGSSGTINGGGGGGAGTPSGNITYGGSGGEGTLVTFNDNTGESYINPGGIGGNGGNLTTKAISGADGLYGSILLYYYKNYEGNTNPYTRIASSEWYYHAYNIPGTYNLSLQSVDANILVCGGGGLGGYAGTNVIMDDYSGYVAAGGGGGGGGGSVVTTYLDLAANTNIVINVGTLGESSSITYNNNTITAAAGSNGSNGANSLKLDENPSGWTSGGLGGQSIGGIGGFVSVTSTLVDSSYQYEWSSSAEGADGTNNGGGGGGAGVPYGENPMYGGKGAKGTLITFLDNSGSVEINPGGDAGSGSNFNVQATDGVPAVKGSNLGKGSVMIYYKVNFSGNKNFYTSINNLGYYYYNYIIPGTYKLVLDPALYDIDLYCVVCGGGGFGGEAGQNTIQSCSNPDSAYVAAGGGGGGGGGGVTTKTFIVTNSNELIIVVGDHTQRSYINYNGETIEASGGTNGNNGSNDVCLKYDWDSGGKGSDSINGTGGGAGGIAYISYDSETSEYIWSSSSNGSPGDSGGGGGGGAGVPIDQNITYGGAGSGTSVLFADGFTKNINFSGVGGSSSNKTIQAQNGASGAKGSVMIYYKINYNYSGTKNIYTNKEVYDYFYYSYQIPGTYTLKLDAANVDFIIVGGSGQGGTAGNNTIQSCSNSVYLAAGGGGGGGGGQVVTRTITPSLEPITIVVGERGQSSYIICNGERIEAQFGANGQNGSNDVCTRYDWDSGGKGSDSINGTGGGAGGIGYINYDSNTSEYIWSSSSNGFSGTNNGGGGGGAGTPSGEYITNGGLGIGTLVNFSDSTGSVYFGIGGSGGNGSNKTIAATNGRFGSNACVVIYYNTNVNIYTGEKGGSSWFYNYYRTPGTYSLTLATTGINYYCVIAGGGGQGGTAGSNIITSCSSSLYPLIAARGGGGGGAGQVVTTEFAPSSTPITIFVGDIGESSYIIYNDEKFEALAGTNGQNGSNSYCSIEEQSGGNGNGGDSIGGLSGAVVYEYNIEYQDFDWKSSADGSPGTINGGGGGGAGTPQGKYITNGGAGAPGTLVEFMDGTGSVYINPGGDGGKGSNFNTAATNGQNAPTPTGVVMFYYNLVNEDGSCFSPFTWFNEQDTNVKIYQYRYNIQGETTYLLYGYSIPGYNICVYWPVTSCRWTGWRGWELKCSTDWTNWCCCWSTPEIFVFPDVYITYKVDIPVTLYLIEFETLYPVLNETLSTNKVVLGDITIKYTIEYLGLSSGGTITIENGDDGYEIIPSDGVYPSQITLEKEVISITYGLFSYTVELQLVIELCFRPPEAETWFSLKIYSVLSIEDPVLSITVYEYSWLVYTYIYNVENPPEQTN